MPCLIPVIEYAHLSDVTNIVLGWIAAILVSLKSTESKPTRVPTPNHITCERLSPDQHDVKRWTAINFILPDQPQSSQPVRAGLLGTSP